jgi:hypothetical protein
VIRLIWGAAEIGKAIGRSEKQVYYLWSRGRLASVRKIGERLVADADALQLEIARGRDESAA